ncbi:MAG: alanyl-tRNA editing protein [Oscillospiraceae bacterium]|nr:alanyl-tRNA editing protein [Oscillospiraceae bacterium]
MHVKKLYYEDCHLREFTAKVVSCRETDGGFQIELDQTAFYPEGGGQACDLGTLDDVAVLDVQEREDKVLHLCDGPLAVGQTVAGKLDWARRFDLMQQHTGEHILSGTVYEKYGYHNVGFHMGADTVTVDFDGIIPPEDLPGLQKKINEVLWQDLPVKCWYPAEDELPGIFYRTKRTLPWPVRIVQIPGVDSCACCGVQVARTGEVGIVYLLSAVKFHQGTRIEMVSGGRAYELLHKIYEQNRQVSQAFSVKTSETGQAAREMNERLAQEKYRFGALQKQMFGHIAQEYAEAGDTVYFAEDLMPDKVRELADAIADTCGGIACVLSGNDEDGYNFCLVSRTKDVRDAGRSMAGALGGRGGGRPEAFQGKLAATAEKIREYFTKK